MRPAAVLLLLGLAGCADGGTPLGDLQKEQAATAPQAAPARTAPRVAAARATAPHIYMSLQPDDAGPVSIVFAIDASRDNTPTDDPAIRITPADGKCNPQELRTYAFPADTARRPIFGADEAASGVAPRQLPEFMAMAVTSEMLRRGLVEDVEQSKPQNVCTYKLWQQMIVNESLRTG